MNVGNMWFLPQEIYESNTTTTYSKIDLTKAQYKDFIGVTNLNSLQILITKPNNFHVLQHIVSKWEWKLNSYLNIISKSQTLLSTRNKGLLRH